MATILRINVNPQALVKTTEILSNSVLLTANAYLLGTGIQSYIRDRKRDQISGNLQTAAEIASACAGLTKVVTETIGLHYMKNEVQGAG